MGRTRTSALLLALLALGVLVFAPGAQASKGVFDSFGGFGTEGGKFGQNVGGVAVNESSGEFYVVETTQLRVQRFSSDSEFISTWGMDVIKAGAPGDTGTGYEICTVASDCKRGNGSQPISGGKFAIPGTLGGELANPRGIAINQSTGDVYVPDSGNRRVQQFTASGAFIRAWGYDVVATGPGNSSVNEEFKLTITATGGNFTLSFPLTAESKQTTAPLPHNASAVEVQNALNGLSTIGDVGGSVSVTGGPGDETGSTPYVITFGGSFAGNQVSSFLGVSSEGLTGGSPTPKATVTRIASGGAFEICSVAANCKAGGSAETGGAFTESLPSLAVAPAGAPNAGNVLVRDRTRVQEFTAAGVFVRALGWNVVASGPSKSPSALNEQQILTVKADGGKFSLSFTVSTATTATTGTGDLTQGSTTVVVKSVTNGTFEAGQPISGSGIPTGTTIAATGPGTLTLSQPASSNQTDAELTAQNLAFNASAAQVEAALNALPNIGGVGGSVTVSGGPGDAGGANPYLITFGGALAGEDLNQLFTSTNGLTLGSGTPSANVSTQVTGGAFEICRASASDVCRGGTVGSSLGQFTGAAFTDQIAVDASGNIYTSEESPNFRVQKFVPSGPSLTPELFNPSIGGGEFLTGNSAANAPIGVAIGESGNVLVLKGFPGGAGIPPAPGAERRVLEFSPAGALLDTHMAGAELSPAGAPGPSGMGASTGPDGRIFLTRSSGNGSLEPRVFILDEVPPLSVTPEATEAGAATAVFHATITPSPIPLHTFYRFEYTKAGAEEWKKAPAPPATDVDIGNGASPVAVSQKVEGLEFDVAYQVRVVAYTQFNGTVSVVEGDQFTTQPLPPLVTTGRARWSSPSDTGPSLTLGGTINPGHDQSTYFFEYASEEDFNAKGFSGARKVPGLPAPAGHGLFDVEVLQAIIGLDPSKTYRYRLVSTNSAGTSTGAVQSVSPPDPNARFYELVSNADSNGVGAASITAISDDGKRVALEAQTLGAPPSLPAQFSPFLAQRGSQRWDISQITPDPERGNGGALLDTLSWLPADLSSALWLHYTLGGMVKGEVDWTFTDPDGALRAAFPTLVPVTGQGTFGQTIFLLRGGAGDLSAFVFQREETETGSKKTDATYVPGQPLTTGKPGDLYRISAAGTASSILALVNYDSAGNLISNACGTWIGGSKPAGNPGASPGMSLRPVSSDGSITYFSGSPSGSTACNPATNRIRVFKRIGDSSTVEISKSQCTRVSPACSGVNGDDVFQGASANGNRAFFSTTRQLANTDEDTAADLYLYDSSPPEGQPTLVQASAGEVTAGHPKVGSGAEVQGVVDVSTDGSRAYFVAKGQLTAAGTKGANNLYLYQRDDAHPTGRIAFVAKLDGADSGLWGSGNKPAFALPFYGPGGKGPGDGHLLLFSSVAKLSGEDGDTVADLYRYDDGSASIACLTCAGDGAAPVSVWSHRSFANPASFQESRVATEDASVVAFSTKESLVGADANSVPDAYLWDEGQISLISTGNSGSLGVSDPVLSPDGVNALFVTTDRLLPADTNSAADIYNARIGGGFPEAAEVQTCISADECRTAPVGTPNAPSAATPSFASSGNVKSTAKSKCAKGQVKRKGHCMKKAKKKKRQAKQAKKRKANNDRGGRR